MTEREAVTTIRDSVRRAKSCANAEVALAASTSNGDFGATWLRAALLEACGRGAEAAAELESLTDAFWGEERALRKIAIARNQFATDPSTAWRNLAEAVQAARNYSTLAAAEKLVNRMRRKHTPPFRRHLKIAMLGTVTLDLWTPILRVMCFAAGIDAEIYAGPFQQVEQEILDPASGLASFHPEILILALDWRSLNLPDEAADPDAVVRDKIAGIKNLWRGATVIQYGFEVPEIDAYGRLSATLPGGQAHMLRAINNALAKSDVLFFDVDQIAGIYGKAQWHDPVLWFAARQYPATDAIALLMRHQTALLRAVAGLTSKCIALDLDGTLWGGIIGEDGVAGIRLGGSPEGEAYAEFQRYLLALNRRGIPLAICSKNNDADARAPFEEHPEMVLKLEDIAVFAANWSTKDQNLRHIARTLNIGIDSIVFLDDNPIERALVRELVPEVTVPELPSDPALYVATLHRGLHFEALALTQEDRQRAASYRQNSERQNSERQTLATTSGSVDEFLAGLNIQIELRPFDQANLARIVQLINKTNQFNLTTRRMTSAEVSALLDRNGCYTQFMRLRDKFGDSGLTGILIALEEHDTFRIDNWLISCRVLGRRVEDAMLAAALKFARLRGLREVRGEYIPTPKNAQVSAIYEKFGFSRQAENSFSFALNQEIFTIPDWLKVDDATQDSENETDERARATSLPGSVR